MCVHTLRVYVCVKFFKVLQCFWKLAAWFLLSSQAVRVRVPKAKDLSMKLLKLPRATAPAAADVSQVLVPKVGSMKNNCHTHQRTLYTHTYTWKSFSRSQKLKSIFFFDFFFASYGFFHSAGQTINPGSPVTKIRGDNIDVDNATMRLRSICPLSLPFFLSSRLSRIRFRLTAKLKHKSFQWERARSCRALVILHLMAHKARGGEKQSEREIESETKKHRKYTQSCSGLRLNQATWSDCGQKLQLQSFWQLIN